MSVFNDSKYLEQSIQSILKQSFSNFEFIIIDDGSKDKTYEIVNRNMKMDMNMNDLLVCFERLLRHLDPLSKALFPVGQVP